MPNDSPTALFVGKMNLGNKANQTGCDLPNTAICSVLGSLISTISSVNTIGEGDDLFFFVVTVFWILFEL